MVVACSFLHILLLMSTMFDVITVHVIVSLICDRVQRRGNFVQGYTTILIFRYNLTPDQHCVQIVRPYFQ